VNDALALLAAEIRACRACPLYRSAKHAVPGEGTGEAGIFFLGEAPGFHEDLQGRPFVGPAGQLLDELLHGIGLDRAKVFITNVVRHRPPENRDPLPDEVAACDVWLRRHIEVLKPRVIVTLGRHALYKFLPGEPISRAHGRARIVEGLTLFPVYHPAAVLHQPGMRAALEADFAALARFLAEPRPDEVAEPERQKADQLSLFG
jgi:uracil-DNA glycosylase family 4